MPAAPPTGSVPDLPAPAPAATPPIAVPPEQDLDLPGVRPGEVRQLSTFAPVVRLTGAQLGTGPLRVAGAIPDPYDLILVCAYETRDQREGIVVPSLRPAGPDPANPIFTVSTEVGVDLARLGQVNRFFVVGVPRRGDLRLPGGTLSASTVDGTRLDVPMGSEVTLGAKALLTAYVIDGDLVLRAEHDPYSGTLRQVCDAYGYSELSWRDDFTPL